MAQRHVVGCILGTAVGDALGLPYEGLSRRRVSRVRDAVKSAATGQSVMAFAASLGLSRGVSGYVYDSVPIAINAWLSHQNDFRSAVTAVVACGGDTDSTGAIVGGIVGASVGQEGIPLDWLNHLSEWPRSIDWMQRLGAQLDRSVRSGAVERPITLPVYGVLPRNVFFLLIVLSHGVRRLLPPY